MINYEIPKNLKKYEEIIAKTFRYSNEITFECEDTKPWESKLGGCPYLEDINDYPMDDENRPMMFIAQINFEEIKGIEELPEKGLLQFYVKNEELYGLESDIEVKYIENYIKDESKLVKENPYENDEEYKYNLPFSNNGKMYFETRQMPVSTSIELFDELFKDKLSKEEYEQLADDCYASDSRVGGYPYFVQNDYVGFDEDEFLLLQLDIEDKCGIMFGDAGNCTFTISKDDLKKRDFSKVVYDWQCC